MQTIDLRSDTITLPSKEMKEAMFNAKIGDDVFGEDETTIELEQFIAKMFGMEAAVYCPSGTMTNQIAIRVHAKSGDEVICHEYSHVYNFEGGGIAANTGASTMLLKGDRGFFTAEDVKNSIHNIDDFHHPLSRMVVIENTSNKGGGSIWNIEEIKKIKKVCIENNLSLHLDGARLFNALVETGESPTQYGEIFDSISICLSKGLGAPIGSLLLGSKEFVYKSRRVRKMMGGGMRQTGFVSAAGLYALKNNVERLKDDHKRARIIADGLSKISYVTNIRPVETNIVIFDLDKNVFTAESYIRKLKENNILVVAFGSQTVRMVTHLDFTDEMLQQLLERLKNI